MKYSTLLLSFLLMAAISTGAKAQSGGSSDPYIKNTIGIGPRLGYYKSNDADEGNFYGGLQLRMRLGKVLGLEGTVEYRSNQTFKTEVLGQTYKTDVRQVPVTASLMTYLPVDPHFEPYLLGGIGAYYTIVDYSSAFENNLNVEDDSKVNLGFHLGFGLDLPINNKVSLNADYRYLFLDGNNDNIQDKKYSGNVFTAGLTFYI